MNRYCFKPVSVCVLVVVLLAVAGIRVSAAESDTDYSVEECIECHRTDSEESERHISIREFEASVHSGEAECMDCHTRITDDEHQSVEGSGVTDCSGCHEQENRHGAKGPEDKRPQCYKCHTRHNMRAKDDAASTVHASRLPVTCGACHAAASGKENWFSWFPAFQIASHNKADFGAAFEKTNCLGCHQGAGAHGETEAINAQTCHRCHASAPADGAMWGRIHPQADMKTQPAVFAAALTYQVAMVIGLVLLSVRLLKRRRPPVREIDSGA